MATMKLYDFPTWGFARKVRTALAEKGSVVEMIKVDLWKGEQRHPDYI